MLMKKSQTATEYLIILAVVIIIALIVIGVLGGIPGVGSGIRSNADRTFWRTSQIAIDSLALSPDGSGSVILRNNLPHNIQITNLSLQSGTDYSFNATPRTLAVSGTGTFRFYNDTNGNITGVAGDPFNVIVKITYQDTQTNAQYTFPPGDDKTFSGVFSNN